MSVTGRHPHARATIRDIADRAGVSIATVSRVLNGRPDVAPDTREAVLEVARQLRFSTNRSARSLSGGRTGLIGVLVPLVFPQYFSFILAGAAEALAERDLRVLLSPTGDVHEREVSFLDRLMHGLTDGALIVLPQESSEELERFLDEGYRFVVVDPRLPLHERIPAVSAAHTSGADQAMRHLLELGHRRIAQITGPRGWVATEDRRRGYRAALAAAGILPDPVLEVEAIPELEPGRVAAERLLDLPERPTAIFAFNDNIAIGAIQAARARGLHVPEDLSVVGFDDQKTAAFYNPPLTTVNIPRQELGRRAAQELMDRFGGREAAHEIVLPTKLIVRESTAAPRARRKAKNATTR